MGHGYKRAGVVFKIMETDKAQANLEWDLRNGGVAGIRVFDLCRKT